MPEFSCACGCNSCNKNFTKEGIIRSIRYNIATEYEAIQLYEQLMESTDDKRVKKVLREIIDDERTHAGCFLELLKMLCPEEENLYADGAIEVKELLKEK